MWRYLKRLLIGKPLKTTDEGGQSLTKFKALALLSSDALSSVAYGTEQITTILITLSAAALMYQIWVAALVLVLLAAITLSYQQIIHAYPSGGGAYVVASTNWGEQAGLIAGGSLLVDYMLTVAVSTTSATEAITSAIPSLYSHGVLISCLIVVGIMLLNLRGIRESASFLTLPVYLFIIMIIAMIIYGGYNIVTGNIEYHAAAHIGAPVEGMTLVRFFRAFPQEAVLLFPDFYTDHPEYPLSPYGQNMILSAIQTAFTSQTVIRPYDALASWIGILLELVRTGG